MNEVAVLIKREYGKDDAKREVLCGIRSIGMGEFYQSSATDFHPDLKLILIEPFALPVGNVKPNYEAFTAVFRRKQQMKSLVI